VAQADQGLQNYLQSPRAQKLVYQVGSKMCAKQVYRDREDAFEVRWASLHVHVSSWGHDGTECPCIRIEKPTRTHSVSLRREPIWDEGAWDNLG
jgi:hypothetical protein